MLIKGVRGAFRRPSRALAVAALLAALVPTAAQAGAPAQAGAQTWEVQAGGSDTGGFAFGGDPAAPPPNFIAQAFLPNPVTIRVGDTVKWSFADLHTVTFNSGRPEQPLVVGGPNPGEAAAGPAFFPMGVTGPGPVSYDGMQQVSSGAPLSAEQIGAGFSMTFTRTGTFGYVCMLHPGMRGEVEVREAGAPLPESPAQAKARGQVTLGALLGKAREGAGEVRPISVGTVHTALVGLGDPFGASALRFLGGDKTVRRGDTVIWAMADPFELHTVTFLSGTPQPNVIDPRPQPAGPPLLVFPANVVGPAGGETYTGQAYTSSGFLEGGAMYGLRFDAPPGRYEYLCLLHPYMKGAITVSG